MSSKQMTHADNTDSQNSQFSQDSYKKSALESIAISLEISPNDQISDHHIVKMIEYMMGQAGKEIRFIIDIGKFVIWDKTTAQWTLSEANEHFDLLQNGYLALQKMFNSMLSSVEGKEEKAKMLHSPLGQAFGKALAHRRTKMLLECLAAQPGYTFKRGIFDNSNELLPLTSANGVGLVYDLRIDALRLAKKKDFILLKPAIRLSDEGKNLLARLETSKETWLKDKVLGKVLNHLFEGRDDLARLCQQVFGYCLRGDNPSQKFFPFIGGPGTGKSTLVNALHRVLGSLSATVNSEVITRGNKALTTDDKYQLGRLEGKRFAMIGEPATEAKLSESLIKAITGESSIIIREIYGHPREVEPKAKMIATTNSTPVILDPSGAMHRRMILLRTYAETITTVGEKYYEVIADKETDEFLAWMILGHKDWRANGFVGPDECFGRSASVIIETSELAGFVTADLENDKAWMQVSPEFTERVYCEDVYHAYVAWVKQTTHRENFTSKKLFNKKFRQLAQAELGMVLPEDSKNGVHWKCVRIVRGV